MQVTALVEAADHVCCRYRLNAFRPALEATGHRLDVVPLPRSWWHRLTLGPGLDRADLVVLQRKLLSRWQTARIRRHARRLVFDLDDAVWLRDSFAPRGLTDPRRERRFTAIAQAADAVVGGNAFLCRAAAERGAPITMIIPTCVDPTIYPRAEHTRRGAGVRLVWIGSSSTLKGLALARPLLEAVGRRVPGLELTLVCDRFLAFESPRVRPVTWSEAAETSELAAADIGIAWVPDDDWSRGKCGLKVLQYMAAGLPVVANPVGVQAELVRVGETGFLASTAEEWADAVAQLAADPDLRRRLGAAGRARVEAEYSIAAGAARWVHLLDRLALDGRQAG